MSTVRDLFFSSRPEDLARWEEGLRLAGLRDRIRITTQLLEADTGNHLWAHHYDRDIRDVFSVQDEIVHAIAAIIEGRVAASGA
jgi:TolB-like protein